MKCLDKVKQLPFIPKLEVINAQVYIVGGAVRDNFRGKESKDLDIMICDIEEEALITVLNEFGHCDLVGKSFGVIKWREKGSSEDIDIALPRRDRKGEGDKHTDIIVEVDTTMSIEEELKRRDFTINAMALSLEGELIDPFNGLKDLSKGVIRMVDPQAFVDDPLRMLRAIQFASRFDFIIEEDTLIEIKSNVQHISSISKERIVEELKKIVKGGDVTKGVAYLGKVNMPMNFFTQAERSQLYVHFTNETYEKYQLKGKIKTLAELIWMIGGYNVCTDIARALGVDNKTIKEIDHLERMQKLYNLKPIRVGIFEALLDGVDILNSTLFSLYEGYDAAGNNYGTSIEITRFKSITKCIAEFKGGHYPHSFKELAVNGNDLLEWGYKGVDIGITLKLIVRKIMERQIENDKKEIKYFLKGV